MKYLKQAKDLYARSWPGEDVAPVGAAEEMVRDLERQLGGRLPGAYREFLLWMGNDVYGLLSDGCWWVGEVMAMTQELGPQLARYGAVLPDGPVVCFFNYQGYQAAWFDLRPTDIAGTDEDEDPVVHAHGAGLEAGAEGGGVVSLGRFSAFITGVVGGHVLEVERQVQKGRGVIG